MLKAKIINLKEMKINSLKVILIAALPMVFACNTKTTSSSESDSTSTETATADGTSTSGSGASYVSLNSSSGSGSSSSSTQIIRDTTSGGGYIYAETRKPIEADLLFVDVSSGDTLYGPSGDIVNNALIQENGTWKLDEAKIKRDGNKIKIKSGDDKMKMDEDEMKMKTGDSKTKVDVDDDSKIKTPDSKTKVDDDGETKVKPR